MWFVIWKGRKKKFAKSRIRTQVDRAKGSIAHASPSAPLVLMIINRPL